MVKLIIFVKKKRTSLNFYLYDHLITVMPVILNVFEFSGVTFSGGKKSALIEEFNSDSLASSYFFTKDIGG